MSDTIKPVSCAACEKRRLFEQRCEMAAKLIRRGKVQAALDVLEGRVP